MSDTAPEADAPQPRSSGSSPFTRKLGPLPLWAWMGLGLALGLTYYLIKKDKASATAASSTTAAGVGTAGGTTDSSLIPQFVNQTYVTGAPPSAPPVTGATGPAGSTGATGAPGATGTAGSTPAAAQASIYPAPADEKVSKLSNTTAKVTWNYITSATPKPTSYTIAAYTLAGKLAQQITVNAPDTASGVATATLSGLAKGQKYNIHVWANGGKQAPPHSTAELTL